MTLSKIVAFALVCGSSAAMAQVARVAPPAPAAPAPEKKICRRETPLGSIMANRVCHTRAEWDALNAQNGADAERALDKANRNGGSGLSQSSN